MPPPRYVVHVGPMKTASTYIQRCFMAVQPALQARGIYYAPELIDLDNKHTHMPVFEAIVRNEADRLRPVFAAINKAGHEIVVLSCEQLIFLRPGELATLCDVIGTSNVEIVYVVRRWSDRIASLWNQSLFMGGSQTLPEFYLELLQGRAPDYYPANLGPLAGRYDLDYSLVWREIASVVGRQSLRLFPYSMIMDAKDDVFVRFCSDVLGLRDVPVSKLLGARWWGSFPKEEAEMLRALNNIYLKHHDGSTVAVRELMMSKAVPFDDASLRDAMAGEGAELTIDDRSVQFESAYDAMAAYADRIVQGPGVVPGEIFARVSRRNGYVRQDWMLVPGATDALRAIYARMMASLGQPA